MRNKIIPEVKLDNAVISEAVDYLRIKSIEMDTRDYPVNLAQTSPPPLSIPSSEFIRISINEKDISYWDTLAIITEQTGLSFQIPNYWTFRV